MGVKISGAVWSGAIRLKLIVIVLILAGGAGYYYHRRSPAAPPAEVAYVLPASATVVDTPAEIHLGVATLKQGDRVELLERTKNWARVRLADGRVGWVEAVDLLDSASYEKGQRLFISLQTAQPQAAGHTTYEVNLHLDPARDATQLAQLSAGQNVEIFGRRLVERAAQSGASSPTGSPRDAWYLVRAGKKAGWILGRLVTLDIPDALAPYSQSTNMVGWLVLNSVDDSGRKVPEYLAVDREGTQECDFTHLRVFTWWVKRQEYVTAYVESNLNGYFPIRSSQVDGIPHFRLRLMDEEARKFQRIYGMFNTIVRPIGIVEGWESQAMPARPAPRARHARPPSRRPR